MSIYLILYKSAYLYTLYTTLFVSFQGDFNVVLVGWARGAAFPDYEQAVANTRLVGAEIKVVVNEMVAEGLNLNDVHLIGHSLGAQTSGTAGKLLNGQVGRITGLDPARPSYEFLHEDVRLDAKDAKFVDIIHTNSEAEPEGQRYGYGVHQESGTVDFYVNGGRKQPGCHDIYVSSILGSLVGKRRSLADLFACSHGRSHQYFLESIKSQCTFTAYKCDSYENFETGQCNSCANNACNVMGLNTDPNKALGSLYLDTNSTSPYCSQTAGPLYGSE
ncbi:pancreatic lipase-related protein 2 [Aplysia californica]|uniref:Pancreatic lipase-related protein 2 n=1 Tax=Aplysia californica TaxID=6500 RepID=A0ABM1VXF2_APLCA|nr:pancreatic lipase-related protein 2 [Aplysia californica]